MGISTDGQICFGILLDDGIELPWDAEPYDGDIDEWWIREIHGFKPSVEIFDESGMYLNGVAPDQALIDQHFTEISAARTAHPLPVELVNVCHSDEPIWIVAVHDWLLTANRGCPVSFNPADLVDTKQMRDALRDFVALAGIDTGEQQPNWWLSSNMG